MGKINFWAILIKYIDTLRDYRTNKISPGDVTVQLVIPALLSVALFFKWSDGWVICEDLITNLISCISIISGLMCGVAVLLFQLRLQMGSQKDPKPLDREFTLVDESFHISMWVVLDGLLVVGFLCIAPLTKNINEFFSRLLFCLAAFFLLNFLLVTLMALKRISAAYTTFSRGWKM
ncbi:hypothetical protein [Collinsella aerofaciens]|uniref:hypothetical protein n=1 Tax=Collinsella aerofaciens TaxID=74426 RepID=UPI00189CE092|nr:hypothetical protein [Collinsella aerofaciens]